MSRKKVLLLVYFIVEVVLVDLSLQNRLKKLILSRLNRLISLLLLSLFSISPSLSNSFRSFRDSGKSGIIRNSTIIARSLASYIFINSCIIVVDSQGLIDRLQIASSINIVVDFTRVVNLINREIDYNDIDILSIEGGL